MSNGRIALFLPFLGGRGAQRVLLNLANGFAATGRPVDLVLAEAKGEFLNRVSPQVRLIDLKSPRGVLRCLPAYCRYLHRERPAVLLTAMDYINVLSVLTRAVSSRRTKLFVSCHTSLRLNAGNSPWVRDQWLPLAVRLTYRHADGVIAVSGGVADTLAQITRLPRERLKVLYNPVVTPGFEADAAAPLDHPWFQTGQPPVVLGVGSLGPEKDFGTLLRAFALVRAQRPARLVILGEGRERVALEHLAVELGVQADVALPGWVANPYSYMARAGVFVLSSRWEGFGLVIAEALACGTSVVSTDCPSGPSEILENGRHGMLVPMQDPDAMAKAILDTLGRAPDRDALQRRARDFTLEKVVREYLNYFDSLAA
jgi:glycosyltransferase involved in cell wall biosynthesis